MSFRSIYEPRTRAREYSDLAINIYSGCNHGCKYCYARQMFNRYHPTENFADVKPRDGIVEAVKNQLSGGKYRGKKIMLCFMCDPYPAEIDTTPTREIIKLIKAAGANVSILTKGGMRAVRDFDLYGKGDSFGCTLTFHNDEWRKRFEPNAAEVWERYQVLGAAHKAGIKTWASLEPVIIPEETLNIIRAIHFDIDLFKVGKWNHDTKANLIDWKKFGNEAESLLRQYGKEYYIKEDLRKEMEK
jgi:DNA repair photolyase